MVRKKIEDLAGRVRNPKFLEEEAKEEEKTRRAIEEAEELRRTTEEARLLLEEKQREYQDKIINLDKENYEDLFKAFIDHPDFPRIYNQLETIETISSKWSFILRRAYEIGNEEEVDLHIGYIFQHNEVKTKRKFEDYGIYLLCPYFQEDSNSPTNTSPSYNQCSIDVGRSIDTLCDGKNEICKVYEDRAKNAAFGKIQLPVINKSKPKFEISKIDVDPIDLRDLEDWWQGEGKYE